MKLISWNVNGIRSAHTKGLAQFAATADADVLCLQETKIHCETLIPEDDVYRSHAISSAVASTKKGYSGVSTFTKSSAGLNSANSVRGFGVKIFDDEGRTVINDYGPVLLYNVYIPSGTSGDARQKFKYSFLDAFARHLAQLKPRDKERLVVCGDFNICHKEIDIHHPREAERRQLTGFLPDERKWLDQFCELGFADTFRLVNGEQPHSYSWWSFRANSRAKNLGWRIDYFFVSKQLAKKVSDAQILASTMGSDHCPITLELNI